MKTLSLAILFLLPLLASGQSFVQLIASDTMLNILCNKLVNYDSLILYSQSSYNQPDTRLKGIAYAGVNEYLFCIEFSFPLTADYNRHPFFSKEVVQRSLPEEIATYGFMDFNRDSLTNQSCNGLAYVSSHGPATTLIRLYPREQRYFYWQADNVESYEASCPNSERAKFIQLIRALNKLVPIKKACEQKRDFFIIEP